MSYGFKGATLLDVHVFVMTNTFAEYGKQPIVSLFISKQEVVDTVASG